ncbi:glycosyltransferase family 4 protein [Curtobacterium sp. MCLR17_055]|uniref:glycosyltransferase family 4 protein n=1 Tax=Curtobacterium sp. MCLR17_055 TaxID=2175633 RepID=UPI000DA84045|nr:glycosyltransferase family 4 protein [Curtobacterium sp. MCLR17_055]PZE28543.1 glycosyltransferase WbuB [Curtobacterium sp. MCLR17_055]
MTSPLSVLLIGINFAPETTGIAPYSTGLTEDLVRRGGRVRVLTAHAHYPQWRFDGAPGRHTREERAGVRIERFRHRLPSKPGGLARALSEVSFGIVTSTTRFGRPDVLVLVSPALLSSAISFVRSRLFTRVPVVIWVQDLYSLGLDELGERPGLMARAVARLEGWLLRRADGVVVIHERFRDTVVERMNVLPSKVTVVRNWSHLEEIEVVDRVSSRKELGWADDDIIVLHAGNMGVKQGLENVVEAARLASEQGSRVRFVLLGDGNQRTMLEQAATGVEALRMLPSLSDDAFRRALAAADVLLVNERPGVAGMAVPSKLTSYFSTGLPVIAATDPGSVTESEILLSGGGTSVPAGDPQALLSAAEMLGGDSLRSVEMGRSGRRFRDERLSSRASFDTYAQLLQGLAQGRRTDTSTGSGND